MGNWIYCNKELPKKHEQVLVCGPDLPVGEAYYGPDYSDDDNGKMAFLRNGMDLTDRVACWMPLPEAPKEF